MQIFHLRVFTSRCEIQLRNSPGELTRNQAKSVHSIPQTLAGHLPGTHQALHWTLDLQRWVGPETGTQGLRWAGEGRFRLWLFALVIMSIAFTVVFLIYFVSFFPKVGEGKIDLASGNNLQILTLS